MSQAHVKYLLAGGGLASGTAAEAIRMSDTQGGIMLVGQEINRPYQRRPLSREYLRRQIPRSELMLKPIDWFDRHNVELRTGRRVAHVDTARRSATLDSGEEINFDALLLATGASPRTLQVAGAQLPNVYYLRTIEDVDRLHHAIDKARSEGQRHDTGRGRVAVIGAGLLGLEIAASLTQMSLAVDLIVSQNWPWAKYVGEVSGKFIGRYLEKNRVAVHTGRMPQMLEGDGRVQRVILSDGRSIPCDMVIPAIGMTVNREILRGTPIAAERAILVDSGCRTNVAGIFAAGDCAAVFDPIFGKHRVIDHSINACITGRIAGINMAGGNAGYNEVSHFSSEAFDLKLDVWGEPRIVHHRLSRGNTSVEQPDFIELGIAADGRIAQITTVNHPGEDPTIEALVRARADLSGQEEAVKDPAFKLSDLL
jgi:NAD(P)H-nitrite reductase large subunit